MPSVRGIPGAYRFFFYSFDCNEPAHVHILWEKRMCKFWLEPVMLAGNDGFAAHELGMIRKLVSEQRGRLLEAWHEHCGN